MESLEIKKVIEKFEEISGNIKDVKDFNSIITNILKKKNVKNKTEIIINFLDNLKEVKRELKSNKKLEKSIYSIILADKGEEKFIKEILAKLEERSRNDNSCANLLKELCENKHKFSTFKNLINDRLKAEGQFFQEYFQSCYNHQQLIQKMFESKFIEDNIIHHFLEFWNRLEKAEENPNNKNKIFSIANDQSGNNKPSESPSGDIFTDLVGFKALFLQEFRFAIINQIYSLEFIEELRKKKIPREFDICLSELNYNKRQKIDAFITEFHVTNNRLNIQTLQSFKNFFFEFFDNKKDKFHLFENFLDNLDFYAEQYNKENVIGTIFEVLFHSNSRNKDNNLINIQPINHTTGGLSNKEIFISKLADEFCDNACLLYLKCQKLFNSMKSYLSENISFSKQVSIFKTITKLKHKAIISLFEEIKGNNYSSIAANLLQYSLNEKSFENFSLLLQSELSQDILNYFLIENTLHRSEPIIEIITKSLDYFLNNLIEEIIKAQNFKKQKMLILVSFMNCCKINPSNMSNIMNLKDQYTVEERKRLRYLYSRFLAYEIDIYFLYDFIPKNDFEKISSLINRLIRSQKYQEALIILAMNQFDERIFIEKEYEDELFQYFTQKNLRVKKHKLRFLNQGQTSDFAQGNDYLCDVDYDESYDEFLDAEEDLFFSEEAEIQNQDNNNSNNASQRKKEKNNKSSTKKILDYIMYFEYKRIKLDQNKYFRLIRQIGMPNMQNRMDFFQPFDPNAITIDVARENIYFVDNLKDLKNLQGLSNGKLAIDFEYNEDTVSLIQLSDNKNVYLIDYLLLIQQSEFFPVFSKSFKNCIFLAFDMGGSDMRMLNDDFRNFFLQSQIFDIKIIYEKKFDGSKCPSLANLAFMLLDKPLCKYYQCSNWGKRPLLEAQVHYSALDSHILFKIHSALESYKSSELDKQSLCKKINQQDKKNINQKMIREFALQQINFLEAEKQMVENMNKMLIENSLEEILKTHKVIRQVHFQEYDEKAKVYSFRYHDILNLIKQHEKIGIFQIMDDYRVKEIAFGNVENISINTVSIKELKFHIEPKTDLKKFFKSFHNICLIQLSDDTFKSMINAMNKLLCLCIPKYCLDILNVCFPTGALNIGKSGCNGSENYIKEKKDIMHKRLNDVQIEAMNFTMSEQLPVSLIQGPPGTGKSKTIKEIIFQSIKKNKKILVTSFSNAGCDILASIVNDFRDPEDESLKCLSDDKFIRIGKAGKVNEAIKRIYLDEKNKSCFSKICLEKIEKSIYNKEDQSLVDERKIDIENKLNKYNEALLEKSSVVFSTCVSSGSFLMRKYLENRKTFFDIVIIDEASQALEPACWIAMLQAKKVIIVGDCHQIGPIVNTNTQLTFYTLFERMFETYKYKLCKLLTIQYRMNEKIMQFPSRYFYNNNLIADKDTIAKRTLKDVLENRNKSLNKYKNFYQYSNISNLIPLNTDPNDDPLFDPLNILSQPLILIKTEGKYLEKKISTSKYNEGEANIVEFIVDYLLKNKLDKKSIGVITPYAAQVNYLQRIFDFNIDVATVDSFQGSEKDIIIISFVRSNEDNEVGFLADKKRINVALTRAKYMLIMVCDTDTLQCNKFMKDMLKFYLKNSRILTREEMIKINI